MPHAPFSCCGGRRKRRRYFASLDKVLEAENYADGEGYEASDGTSLRESPALSIGAPSSSFGEDPESSSSSSALWRRQQRAILRDQTTREKIEAVVDYGTVLPPSLRVVGATEQAVVIGFEVDPYRLFHNMDDEEIATIRDDRSDSDSLERRSDYSARGVSDGSAASSASSASSASRYSPWDARGSGTNLISRFDQTRELLRAPLTTRDVGLNDAQGLADAFTARARGSEERVEFLSAGPADGADGVFSRAWAGGSSNVPEEAVCDAPQSFSDSFGESAPQSPNDAGSSGPARGGQGDVAADPSAAPQGPQAPQAPNDIVSKRAARKQRRLLRSGERALKSKMRRSMKHAKLQGGALEATKAIQSLQDPLTSNLEGTASDRGSDPPCLGQQARRPRLSVARGLTLQDSLDERTANPPTGFRDSLYDFRIFSDGEEEQEVMWKD